MRNNKFIRRIMIALSIMVSVSAMAFPTRPITVVVPYAAGGSTDVIARVLAEAMAQNLGQPVIIDNVGGAGGTIGTSKVVRAQPDGYTLLLHNMGIATAPALYNKLTFDARTDLAPIGLLGDVPMILVKSTKFAPQTLGDMIQQTKTHPGEVRIANAGIGSTSHLCALLLAKTIGAPVTMVPYRGTGPALQDVVAGNVDAICDQPVATGSHIQAGTVKPYAVATKQRLSILPEVPTFAEAGMQNFELAVWHGLYAPKGTPPAVIQRLTQALQASLKNPALSKRFTDMGVIIPTQEQQSPTALSHHTNQEIQRWAPIIAATGTQAQ